MLFDILDLCLVNLAFASKAGSSPATPTTKELFDIMELPHNLFLFNRFCYFANDENLYRELALRQTH